jgi:predicted Zn-dependent protease with MMP-like domain
MDDDRFDQLVGQALAVLPRRIGGYLDNVNVQVVDEPSAADRSRMRLRGDRTLFGLYVGVPLTRRDTAYTNVAPDRIMIYREPILAACDTEDEVREQIRRTVLHEIGHHFGLNEDDLRASGYG